MSRWLGARDHQALIPRRSQLPIDPATAAVFAVTAYRLIRFGKVLQKVLGVEAVIVDRDAIASLLCQRLFRFGDPCTGVLRRETSSTVF
jgi:hypothetical protein